MADPPLTSEADELPAEPPRDSTGTPRWVKAFGIIAIVVVLLFVIMLVAGGGRHGPARHRLSDSGPGGQSPLSGVTEGGRTAEEVDTCS
jgi:hypothetical protein